MQQYESCVRYFLVLFWGFVRWKVIVNKNVSFIDHASGIRLPDGCKLIINGKKDNDVATCRNDVIVKLFWCFRISFVNFSYWSKFYVNIVTRVTQFPFIKDWPEIRKLETSPSSFYSISGDWGELGIPNLALTSLIKSYWMLQNAKVIAFTISELLRENQQGRDGGKITKLPPPPPLPVAPFYHSD